MIAHVYRRQDDGNWASTTFSAGDEFVLESLGVRLVVAALYRKVRLRAAGSKADNQ